MSDTDSSDVKPAGYVNSRMSVSKGPCVVCGEPAAWSIQAVKEPHLFAEAIGDPVLACEKHSKV